MKCDNHKFSANYRQEKYDHLFKISFEQLNEEQKEIVTSDKLSNMVVLGAAGSGKTILALERIKFLLNSLMPPRILLVTFNRTLIDYAKYIGNINGIKEGASTVRVRQKSPF